MASAIRVGNKWRVQVRRKGFPHRTETFETTILAEKWGAPRRGRDRCRAGRRQAQDRPRDQAARGGVYRVRREDQAVRPQQGRRAQAYQGALGRRAGALADGRARRLVHPARIARFTASRPLSTSPTSRVCSSCHARCWASRWRPAWSTTRELLKYVNVAHKSNEATGAPRPTRSPSCATISGSQRPSRPTTLIFHPRLVFSAAVGDLPAALGGSQR